MKYAIIASTKDIAGMTIKSSLLNQYAFRKGGFFRNHQIYNYLNITFYTIDEETIYSNYIDKEIDADYYLFASRHQSRSGEKTFSTHVPGNFSKADFGGMDNELSPAPAQLLREMYLSLREQGMGTGYDVTLEATHHGPLMHKPVLFIEIGSREQQWRNQGAGNIIGHTIMQVLSEYAPGMPTTAIGFGGPHYCSNFNKVLTDTNIALSHICPKYNIPNLDRDSIPKMLKATKEKVDYAILDWKGLSGENKKHLLQLLKEAGLDYRKIQDVRTHTS